MLVKHGKFILKNKKPGTTPVEVEDPVEGSGEQPPQVPYVNLDDLANEPNQVSASGDAGKPVNEPHDPGTPNNPVPNDPGDL